MLEVGGQIKSDDGGEMEGSIGIENGIDALEGKGSEVLTVRGNVSNVGEVCGVLRRTYVEIGVFAVRSVKHNFSE